eukprot:Clim_evm255s157 gene=Clim_evmTU255s157
MFVPTVLIKDGKVTISKNDWKAFGGNTEGAQIVQDLDIEEFVSNLLVLGNIVICDTQGGANKNVILPIVFNNPARITVSGIESVAAAVDYLDAGANNIILSDEVVRDEQNAVRNQIPQERLFMRVSSVGKGEKAYHEVVEGWRMVCGGFLVPSLAALEQVDPSVRTQERIVVALDRDVSDSREFMSEFNKVSLKADHLTGEIVSTRLPALLNPQLARPDGTTDRAKSSESVDPVYDDLWRNVATCYDTLLKSDRTDGLYTTLVTDEYGKALGLVYSSRESLWESLKTRRGVYQSRKRGLWYKGDTSGAFQDLLAVTVDCDRDCLRFTCHQHGTGFCHLKTRSCFGDEDGMGNVFRIIQSRRAHAPAGSYTHKLFNDPDLLRAKIMEEAEELVEADESEEVAWEAADLMYFTMVRAVSAGLDLRSVEKQLTRRRLRVSRRPGKAKPKWLEALGILPTEENAKGFQPSSSNGTGGSSKSLPVYDSKMISQNQYGELLQRPAQGTKPAVLKSVRQILNQVRKDGDTGLLACVEKFDRVKLDSVILQVPKAEDVELDTKIKESIDIALGNIQRFHQAQMDKEVPMSVETMPGVVCSRVSRPIERVGLYVPGGTAVLPSTAMMLGVPAMVAGCTDITFCTPAREDGSVQPEILYIAARVGAARIVRAGGAHGVAAMAYGTTSVPAVDKILGPGNQYVTCAKMMVASESSGSLTAIDMPAGPSEVMVVADTKANPAFIAADLLSQAEHGVDSQVVLVTCDGVDDQHISEIKGEVEKQVSVLPREDIARAALDSSFVLKCETAEEAINFANAYAAEHLIIQMQNPSSYMDKIQNAGSVFLGPYSPESCGDYASGTNHTLPTYGYARMYSGVSTSSFLKHITAQELSVDGLKNVGPAVVTLAEREGLEAHANAVRVRLQAQQQ